MKNAMEIEKKTVLAMIDLYYASHFDGKTDTERADLKAYVAERLGKCPYQEDKPTCKNCTIHCYEPHMRNKIREVMRYSGPRMLLHKPFLALRHLLHSLNSK